MPNYLSNALQGHFKVYMPNLRYPKYHLPNIRRRKSDYGLGGEGGLCGEVNLVV